MWDLRALIPNISLSAPPSPSFGHKRKKSADKLIISGPRLFPLWLTEIADERTAARRGLLRANGAVSPLDQETDGNNKGDFYDRA